MADNTKRPMHAFAKAAQRSATALPFIDAVLAECTALKDKPFTVGIGNMGNTLVFEDVVVKGPRHEGQVDSFSTEWKIMQLLFEKGVDFVPEVLTVGKESVFFVQKRLAGEMLATPYFQRLTIFENEKQELAYEIAGFIHAMGSAASRADVVKTGLETSLPKPEDIATAMDDPRMKTLLGKDFDIINRAAREYGSELANKKQMLMHTD